MGLVASGCAKKSEPAGSTVGSGTAAGSAGAAEPAGSAAAKPAPAMTPEQFVAEPTKFTIEAMDRGLWISDGGAAFQHKCRVELGLAMGRMGKLRGEAMKTPDQVKCEPRNRYTVCSFALPNADAANPDSQASWIFEADDDSEETVLVAIVFGAHDWAKVEPTIPAKQACPRPSADPQ